jgi:glycosyltransferase involved in cell wall biosynthesis
MLNVTALAQRWRCRLRGSITANQFVSEVVGHALLARARFGRRSPAAGLRDLVVAARRTMNASARGRIHRELKPYLTGPSTQIWRDEQIGWARVQAAFGENGRRRALTTSLLLKAPGPNGEKGILYSSFEYNWLKLVKNHDARAVLKEYHLVGATSWSPPDYAVFGNFAGLSDDPIFMGISHATDIDAYRVMRPVIEPVPLMACDWTNPDFYSPKPQNERTIDILMVANWLPFKRHWLLFQALRRMRRDLRVVLVGFAAPGRTEDDVRAEARAFGVRQEIELLSKRNIDQVSALQCDARLSIVCSRREGSCVAPAESLFADTPIALMEDAHIGVTAHVNAQTGMLLAPARMGYQIAEMLEERERFSPRAWAIEHISCHSSSTRLNAQLRDHELSSGRPWTQDIAPLCWRYVPSYVNAADRRRLGSDVEELRERHGVELVDYSGAAPGR